MAITVGGTIITFNDGTQQNSSAFPTVSPGTLYSINEGGSVVGTGNTWTAGNQFILNAQGSLRIRVTGGSGVYTDSKNGGTTYCQAYYDLYKNGVNLGRVLNNSGNNTNQTGTIDVSITRGDILRLYVYVQYAAYTASGSFNPGTAALIPVSLGKNVSQ